MILDQPPRHAGQERRAEAVALAPGRDVQVVQQEADRRIEPERGVGQADRRAVLDRRQDQVASGVVVLEPRPPGGSRDRGQLVVEERVAIKSAVGDLAAPGVEVRQSVRQGRVRVVSRRFESGDDGRHGLQKRPSATRGQGVLIVRTPLKSRIRGAFDAMLASPVDGTTLSLELFAEFSSNRLERQPPVDAFLGEVLVKRPDIALRDTTSSACSRARRLQQRDAAFFTYRRVRSYAG